MTYIVNDNCIACKYTDCVEVCPVDCFYEGETMLVIHPDECIDCGVCEPECPADAIRPDTEPEMEKWVEFNRKYSEMWPVIVTKKDPLPEADERDGGGQGLGPEADVRPPPGEGMPRFVHHLQTHNPLARGGVLVAGCRQGLVEPQKGDREDGYNELRGLEILPRYPADDPQEEACGGEQQDDKANIQQCRQAPPPEPAVDGAAIIPHSVTPRVLDACRRSRSLNGFSRPCGLKWLQVALRNDPVASRIFLGEFEPPKSVGSSEDWPREWWGRGWSVRSPASGRRE